MTNAAALFEIKGQPIASITMWSHVLNAWVFLVPQKSGQVPPGVYEITPADVARMQEMVDDGWDRPTAIYRVMGVRPQ